MPRHDKHRKRYEWRWTDHNGAEELVAWTRHAPNVYSELLTNIRMVKVRGVRQYNVYVNDTLVAGFITRRQARKFAEATYALGDE